MNDLRRIILILVGIHIISFPWFFDGLAKEKIYLNIVVILLILVSVLTQKKIILENIFIKYLLLAFCIMAIGINGYQAYLAFNEIYGPDIGAIVFKLAYIALLTLFIKNLGIKKEQID